jgi:hypothetical protein
MRDTISCQRERLRWLMTITGLTAGRLAALAGISNPNLYVYLAGSDKRRGFRAETWDAMAQVFGASTDWLTFGRGTRPDEAEVLRAVARRRLAA